MMSIKLWYLYEVSKPRRRCQSDRRPHQLAKSEPSITTSQRQRVRINSKIAEDNGIVDIIVYREAGINLSMLLLVV